MNKTRAFSAPLGDGSCSGIALSKVRTRVRLTPCPASHACGWRQMNSPSLRTRKCFSDLCEHTAAGRTNACSSNLHTFSFTKRQCQRVLGRASLLTLRTEQTRRPISPKQLPVNRCESLRHGENLHIYTSALSLVSSCFAVFFHRTNALHYSSFTYLSCRARRATSWRQRLSYRQPVFDWAAGCGQLSGLDRSGAFQGRPRHLPPSAPPPPPAAMQTLSPLPCYCPGPLVPCYPRAHAQRRELLRRTLPLADGGRQGAPRSSHLRAPARTRASRRRQRARGGRASR